MKKFILLLAVIAVTLQANAATTFKEAYEANGKTPMAVLIYADWAQNYEDYLTVFRKIQSSAGNAYNYVELNIADKDAQLFNEHYRILPRLPYIMLYRGEGKFQRGIDRECAADVSCAIPKMKSFLRQ